VLSKYEIKFEPIPWSWVFIILFIFGVSYLLLEEAYYIAISLIITLGGLLLASHRIFVNFRQAHATAFQYVFSIITTLVGVYLGFSIANAQQDVKEVKAASVRLTNIQSGLVYTYNELYDYSRTVIAQYDSSKVQMSKIDAHRKLYATYPSTLTLLNDPSVILEINPIIYEDLMQELASFHHDWQLWQNDTLCVVADEKQSIINIKVDMSSIYDLLDDAKYTSQHKLSDAELLHNLRTKLHIGKYTFKWNPSDNKISGIEYHMYHDDKYHWFQKDSLLR